MSDLQKVKDWLKTYPGTAAKPGFPDDEFYIDFTHNDPANAGLFPHGIQEIGRRSDICGNTTVSCQYNFTLVPVFTKVAREHEIATQNAEWMMDFQQWIQEQSIRTQAPVFGDIDTDSEVIRAQNGMYLNDRDNGVGAYTVVLTIQFKKYYKGD